MFNHLPYNQDDCDMGLLAFEAGLTPPMPSVLDILHPKTLSLALKSIINNNDIHAFASASRYDHFNYERSSRSCSPEQYHLFSLLTYSLR